MIFVSENGVSFFQFENLQKYPTIRHGIFTRHFGHSRGDFESLNVSFGLGDADDNVWKNRKRVREIVADQDLVFVKQVHGDQVVILNSRNVDSYDGTQRAVGTGDALVTNVSGKF